MSFECKNENGCKYCKIGSNNEKYFVITCGHCKFGYGTSPWSSFANVATIKTCITMKKTIKHK
jgi:hypothetical protein